MRVPRRESCVALKWWAADATSTESVVLALFFSRLFSAVTRSAARSPGHWASILDWQAWTEQIVLEQIFGQELFLLTADSTELLNPTAGWVQARETGRARC